MHRYAQTYLQLHHQLREMEYSHTQMRDIQHAYKFAIHLFAGYFQANGKEFLSHVIGTASILTSLKASPNIIAAGLLHNVYSRGDFGDGQKGGSKARRKQIRQALGEEVEAYVYRFPSLRLAPPTTSRLTSSIEMLDHIDCNVLLIILAEGLEHRLNLEYPAQNDRPKIEMAEKLGFPVLAAGFRRPIAEDLGRFVNPTGEKRGYVIAPKSYRKRFCLVLRKEFTQGFSRLRSSTRVRTRFRRLLRKINATR